MTCPACNQTASTLTRNSFSLQGVTLTQSLKGELRCQHCGVLLRNVKYSRHLWYALVTMAVFVIILATFSERFLVWFGILGVAIYWLALVLLSTFIFIYGMWKHAVLEVVSDVSALK